MPPLAAGQRLGPYEIRSQIGAGGMGHVYRALDTRLGREVAIKVSAVQFTERFEREARLAASLNHPNICTLYDVGPNYLVMEVVEGVTLAERIRQGALPLDEALRIALQVAEALAAAHEQGIVHRDLKPANVIIKPDGTAKVLDFGLACLSLPQPALGAEDAPTVSASLTEAGMILGTAAYMAPEQAEGKPVNRRADIWAFGVVLYEMLTGRQPFRRGTFAATLAAVLTTDPDLDLAPLRTRLLLRRCLERDQYRRLRDIGDARFLLEETAPPTPTRVAILPWVLTGTLALALAATVSVPWHSQTPPDRAAMRLNVDLGPEAMTARNLGAAISPDGKRLAFTIRSADGKRQLATRILDQPQLIRLAGTEDANDPFFSPNGEWIGFFAGGQMKKISVHGGAAVTIGDMGSAFGASWGDDQNIVYTPGVFNGLMRVSSSGGTPQPITKIAEKGDGTHRWPQVLPGGKVVLFTSHKIVTGFDDAQIEAVITQTGERRPILRGGYFGRYFDRDGRSGYLVYSHEGTVFAAGFDSVALELRGSPIPLIEDAESDADTGEGMFDVSSTGTFIYRSGKGRTRTWPILWLDRSGKTTPLVEPGAYYTPKFSPDGNRLALSVDHGDKGREIEVYDLARGNLTRLTSTGEVNLFPVWTPDGKFIACESSSPAGGYGIALVRADGSGKVQRLLEHTGLMIPGSFTPDGRRLAYHETNPETGMDIWTVTVDTSDPEHVAVGKPEPFLRTPVSEWYPVFSPDGHWIAHTSNESGLTELYVRPFPGPGSKVKISSGGGNYAIWDRNGHDLYFRDPDGKIMVVDYAVKDDSFVAGKPRVWSDTPIGSTPFGRDFTLSADGKRFAVLPRRETPQQAGSEHLTFVLNFGDELRRKITAGK